MPDRSNKKEEGLALRILKEYIEFIQELYADDPVSARPLIAVFEIYECSLARSSQDRAPTLDQLAAVVQGIGWARRLLNEIIDNEPLRVWGWYWGCKPANRVQRLVSILSELVMDMTQEITANRLRILEFTRQYVAETVSGGRGCKVTKCAGQRISQRSPSMTPKIIPTKSLRRVGFRHCRNIGNDREQNELSLR